MLGDEEWDEYRASLSLRELTQEAFSSMLLLYHPYNYSIGAQAEPNSMDPSLPDDIVKEVLQERS